MRYEKGRKEASRQRIMEVAAERFRRDGIAATGLAGIMNEAGLTMPQLVALHLLTKLGPVSVSSVATCLKLSAPATSHLVDRLVVAGLVGRSEDPDDRRLKFYRGVLLTMQGKNPAEAEMDLKSYSPLCTAADAQKLDL